LTSASLSITAWPAFVSADASAASASCSRFCFVSIHSARRAPARRKRELSQLPLRSVSSRIAYGCSCGEQLQDGPFTGQPDSAYGGILTAVQFRSGNAVMTSATKADLPTLRHWPPTASRKPGTGAGVRLAV